MNRIQFEFNDYSRHKDKGLVTLTSNKIISLGFDSYPLIWTGYICDSKVEIHQLNDSTCLEDLDFRIFPESYNHLKQKIADEIDEYITEAMG